MLLFTAIVSVSLENLRQGSSQQKQHSKSGPGVHQQTVQLPADYGRVPISEEEMDVINVRGSNVLVFNFSATTSVLHVAHFFLRRLSAFFIQQSVSAYTLDFCRVL